MTFTPPGAGLFEGLLTLESDDPDGGVVRLRLRGRASIPPNLVVTPGSLVENLYTGQASTRTLTLENAGGADLAWRIEAGPGLALENVLAALDSGFAQITEAIPNRYDFSVGETGFYIDDGGDDMYDGGNILGTNFGSLPYSNGTIVSSPAAGAHGRYFTRKYPGLFVLAADMQDVTMFRISGNLGADH